MDPLSHFPKLTMLSLVGNPVMAKANYRCAGKATWARLGQSQRGVAGSQAQLQVRGAGYLGACSGSGG